jgi:protein TonB
MKRIILFFILAVPVFAAAQYNGESISGFFRSNIRYPDSAKYYRLEGTVYIKFWVEADGSIGDISVAKGVTASNPKLQVHADLLANEALRVLKLIPAFKMPYGNTQRYSYTLPVRFRLVQ